MNQATNANDIAGTPDQVLIHALNDTVFAQKQLIAKLNEEIARLKVTGVTQLNTPFKSEPLINFPNFTPFIQPIYAVSPFVVPGTTITCTEGKGEETVSINGGTSFVIDDMNNCLKERLKE